MRAKWRAGFAFVVGSLLLPPTMSLITFAHASTMTEKRYVARSIQANANDGAGRVGGRKPLSKSGKARYGRASALQCVPFARAASGIALKGNAANWWDAAAGVYQRGSEPEAGSVLNFRANGRMRLGHVAVVTGLLGMREIQIEHANWANFGDSKGNVSRGVRVLDVSANNDWSAVRVALGHSNEFGDVYPTYGFIYDRPDSGTMVANTAAATRPGADRPTLGLDEVAEAPARPAPSSATLPVDAPDHSFR